MIRKILLMSTFLSLFHISITSNVVDEKNNNKKSIYGYVYIVDNQKEMTSQSEVIVNVPIQLWKGQDLLLVTQSNERGYFEFSNLIAHETYSIKIESIENYEPLIKKKTVPYSNQSLVNLGYKEKEYPFAYHLNHGYSLAQYPSEMYHAFDLVTMPFDDLPKREGYLFGGWTTCQNGEGEVYQKNDTLIMPSHSVTLYAKWNKIQSKNQRQSFYKQSFDHKKKMDLKDDYWLSFALIVLFIIGIRIVYLSLKKGKNR